jgi:DDE superfamily endonuclease
VAVATRNGSSDADRGNIPRSVPERDGSAIRSASVFPPPASTRLRGRAFGCVATARANFVNTDGAIAPDQFHNDPPSHLTPPVSHLSQTDTTPTFETVVRDNRHDSAHLLGAICPARGVGAAIIMPAVNTEAVNEHLKEISTQVAPGAHAVLVLDGAGWHQTGGDLNVPDNLCLSLPPYAPELNPMESVWEYLRANKLCALVWDTYDAIVEACRLAWDFLINDPDRIRSIGTRDWAWVNV